ncbi:MAG: phage tail sheath subtilisin-like domain-containing protein, partial [Chloroflexota bacterium]
MAPSYLTPGVYVEELPSAGRPIEGVGTSVAAFIGFAEMGPRNKPVLVTNWSQFQQKFGGVRKEYYLGHAVYGYFNNGGGVCYVVNVASPLAPRIEVPAAEGDKSALEAYAIKDGLAAASVSVDIGPAEGGDGNLPADPAAPMFTVSVKAGGKAVESFANVTTNRESPRFVETVVNGTSTYVWLDIPLGKAPMLPAPAEGSYALAMPAAGELRLDTTQVQGDLRNRSGIAGLEAVENVTIVCAPDLMSAYQRGLIEEEALIALQKAMVDHCELMRNRVCIIDSPLGLDPQEVKEWREQKLMVDSPFATLYYPWIRVLGPDGKLMSVPPSGHMAGIWARTDTERGVHKAPANEVVRGAVE